MQLHHYFAPLFVFILVGCGATASPSDSSDPASRKADEPAPSSPEASSGARDTPDAAPPVVGGNCQYESTEGTATITAIRVPKALEAACTNAGRAVEFTFVADDPSATPVPASLQLVDEGNRRLEMAGKAPASACLTELGVTVGATFRATRELATIGTCTPVIYTVAIDFKTCKASCDL